MEVYTSGVRTAIGRIISAAALAGCLACGPAVDRREFEGRWRGERDLPVETTDPVIAYTVRRTVLEVRRDGTFDLFDLGFPKRGRAMPSADALELRVEGVLGRQVQQDPALREKYRLPLRLERLPDGRLRLHNPNDPGSEPVDLAREPKPDV
jgi:hypothetical protein